MSTAKHTPGPWISALDTVSARGTGYTCHLVARCSASRETDIGYDEGLANARLIAAAPELLEACKAFETWLIAPALDVQTLAEMRLKATAAINLVEAAL